MNKIASFLQYFACMIIAATLCTLSSCIHYDFGEEQGSCEVKLTVTDLQMKPMSAPTRANASDFCTRISYAVFNGGERIRYVSQERSDKDFGTLTLYLDPGNYRLVVIAHNGKGNCTITSTEKVTFAENHCTDTFHSSQALTVTSDTKMQVQLQRSVGMFRFVATDSIPEDVAQVQFYYTGGSSTLNPTSGYGCVNSRQTETFTVTSDQYGKPSTWEVYTFPHAEDGFLDITVRTFDAQGALLHEQQLQNIHIQRNYITQHTGAMFCSTPDQYSQSVTITLDPEWAGTYHQ